MTDLAQWLLGLVKALLTAIWDMILDAAINIFDLVLTALATTIAAIPVPGFASAGLGPLLSSIPGDVWFFAGHFRLTECFAVLGAGATFRLTRKMITFFQW